MLIRPATPADAQAILDTMDEGLESYQAFLPGWTPPPKESLQELSDRLAGTILWCAVGVTDEDEIAGHAMVLAAADSRHGGPPELAHLVALFVREPHQGTGLAAALLARAVEHAAAVGFLELRLFTPALHGRARRFYEREGWAAVGPPYDEPALGLAIVEYRRPTAPG